MQVPVVVIGAGQAGLAVSHFLTGRGIEHVVLERGRVGHSWRTERWSSLRLLTPNWQTRLPGAAYDGPDPDGFMTMPEVIAFLDDYARRIAAPVRTGVRVTSVSRDGDGYRVLTDSGTWRARAVVLATGACNIPKVPAVASAVPAGIDQLVPHRYRSPAQLADGGVLVVGAAATGVQIAAEVHAAGRPVTLAVGEHVRMPRSYRGRDVMWWMDRSGIWDERFDELDDVVRARHLPSPQLIGSPQRTTLDLNALSDAGVRLVGRLAGISGGVAQFSGSLRNVCTLADLKLRRLLETFDDWATRAGMDGAVGPVERFRPTRVEPSPPLTLSLTDGGIRTIIWATGYAADHSWLDIPEVLDRKGQLRHHGGIVTGSPGLYRIGLPVLRRRKSSFIHGAEDDARDIIDHLAAHLTGTGSAERRDAGSHYPTFV
ncbi:MAG TPA: NAD(P)-binding domain-containing protein [Nakamurella sp.]|nr:NAD(P)-binding domain-containing protein [Nakamurella sp.]